MQVCCGVVTDERGVSERDMLVCGIESSGEDAKVPGKPGEGGQGDGCHADGEFQSGSFGVGEGSVAGCADVFLFPLSVCDFFSGRVKGNPPLIGV